MYTSNSSSVICTILPFIIGLAIAFYAHNLAKKKGYNPIIWFFAGLSWISLLFLASLPDTKTLELTDEERAKKVKNGNTIGAVLAGIVGFCTLSLIIMMNTGRR